MENFKPRDQHLGPTAPHVGQSHSEKDELARAAKAIDQGPNFGTPGDPPDPKTESIDKIEKAYEDLDSEGGVARSG